MSRAELRRRFLSFSAHRRKWMLHWSPSLWSYLLYNCSLRGSIRPSPRLVRRRPQFDANLYFASSSYEKLLPALIVLAHVFHEKSGAKSVCFLREVPQHFKIYIEIFFSRGGVFEIRQHLFSTCFIFKRLFTLGRFGCTPDVEETQSPLVFDPKTAVILLSRPQKRDGLWKSAASDFHLLLVACFSPLFHYL